MHHRVLWIGLCGATLAWTAAGRAQEPPGEPAATTQPATQEALPGGLARPEEMTSEQLYETALRMRENRQYRDALIVTQTLRARDPTNPDVLVLMAELSEDLGNMADARELWLQLRQARPNDFRANLGLGSWYLKARIPRQATAYLEIAERVAPAERLPDVLALLASAYREDRNLTRALATAQRALDMDPNHIGARQEMVTLRYMRDQFEQALAEANTLLEIIQRAARARPTDPGVLAQLLSAYDMRNTVLRALYVGVNERNERGEAVDRPLPGREAEAANILHQISENLVLQAELRRTLALFDVLPILERAVQFDPDNVSYRMQYGLVLRETGHVDKALEQFRRVLELDPAHEGARRQIEQLGAPATQPAPAVESGKQ